eukprot:COSAG06_NODE_11502_length_1501_cov_6.223966_1_plen_45_part_10
MIILPRQARDKHRESSTQKESGGSISAIDAAMAAGHAGAGCDAAR